VIAAITVMASSQPKMWSAAATASPFPWGSKSLACPSAGDEGGVKSRMRAWKGETWLHPGLPLPGRQGWK
jgi:hypothetical protein